MLSWRTSCSPKLWSRNPNHCQADVTWQSCKCCVVNAECLENVVTWTWWMWNFFLKIFPRNVWERLPNHNRMEMWYSGKSRMNFLRYPVKVKLFRNFNGDLIAFLIIYIGYYGRNRSSTEFRWRGWTGSKKKVEVSYDQIFISMYIQLWRHFNNDNGDVRCRPEPCKACLVYFECAHFISSCWLIK